MYTKNDVTVTRKLVTMDTLLNDSYQDKYYGSCMVGRALANARPSTFLLTKIIWLLSDQKRRISDTIYAHI